MKKFTLKFIQIAWVAETIAILLFTVVAVVILSPERINLWLQFIPAFAILIGAQGTAAGAGPLVADRMKNKGDQ